MKKVSEIMTKEVVTVNPETKIAEVAEIMFKNRYHGLPVVENGKIVGIITQTDFFIKESPNLYLPSYLTFLKENRIAKSLSTEEQDKLGKLLNVRAKDIMTPAAVTILKDMDLHDLLEFFKTTKYYTLPVVDEEDLMVGIVTQGDIIGLIRENYS